MSNRRIREIAVSLGLIKSVIVLTAISVLASWIVTAVVHFVSGTLTAPIISFVISTIVPLIVAPPIGFLTIRLVLELHALEKQMRRQATIDYLTGLLNRREFFRRAKADLNLSRRNGLPFALLYADIDHFKSVNDNYGHAAGDSVLSEVSRIIKSITRSSDYTGRIGGEEFAMALVGTTEKGAGIIAEKIREAIEESKFGINGEGIQTTVSIGISATESEADENLELIAQNADIALYTAKKGGRNRTATYRSMAGDIP